MEGSLGRALVDRALRILRNLAIGSLLATPTWAEPVVVAALGDSLTQGYGLQAEDGFVPQLEAWLQKQGAEVSVLNAGVSGDTTAGGLSRIDWTLTPEVDAVIVALGGNDVLRGLPPEAARANLDGILQKVTGRDLPVLLVGLDVPPNYGSEYEVAFEAIYPELAQQYGALLFENFLAGLTALNDLPTVLRDHMQPDGIHPDASGVSLIVEEMGPTVLELVNRARD